MTKKLFIGIVAYKNSDNQLLRIIESINISLKIANIIGEINIIGNDNKERTFDHHNIKYTKSKNIGFGCSHNILMNRAFSNRFPYYLCINPDGYLHYDAIKSMLETSQYFEDKALIEAIQIPVQHPKPFDPIQLDTPWVSGACFLIPSGIYQSIGGFDSNLFMYCEDVDISWRAKYAGFQLKVEPKAMFYHDISGRKRNLVLERQLMLSGRYLAEKFSCAEFRLWVENAMMENGLIKDKRSLPEIIIKKKYPLRTDIVEFRSAFTFAFPRW